MCKWYIKVGIILGSVTDVFIVFAHDLAPLTVTLPSGKLFVDFVSQPFIPPPKRVY